MSLRPDMKSINRGPLARPAHNGGPGGEVKIVRVSERNLDASLPPADTKRWVMRRKAQVVHGVRTGLLTMEEACARYNISEEEYRSWDRLISAHGVRGLRTTRLQDYRPPAPRTTSQAAE